MIPASVTHVTHTSPADVLMDTFKMSTTETIKETKRSHSVLHVMFILYLIFDEKNQFDYEHIFSSIGVTFFLFNL